MKKVIISLCYTDICTAFKHKKQIFPEEETTREEWWLYTYKLAWITEMSPMRFDEEKLKGNFIKFLLVLMRPIEIGCVTQRWSFGNVCVYVCVCVAEVEGRLLRPEKPHQTMMQSCWLAQVLWRFPLFVTQKKPIGWIPSFLLPPNLDWVSAIHQFFTGYYLIESDKDLVPALRKWTYW